VVLFFYCIRFAQLLFFIDFLLYMFTGDGFNHAYNHLPLSKMIFLSTLLYRSSSIIVSVEAFYDTFSTFFRFAARYLDEMVAGLGRLHLR
jgi:hypothetical protein